MKILVISQHYSPENFRINEVTQALHAKGLLVEVLTGKPNYPEGVVFDGYNAWGLSNEKIKGVKIHRVPLIPRGKGAVQLAINYFSFILSSLAFGTWLFRGRSFDAIFVFGTSPILQAIPAIWLGYLKKCPVLLWVQDLWPESLSATGYITNSSILKLIKHLVRWIYNQVDLILVQSKGFFSKIHGLTKKTPIVYFPNSFIKEVIYSACSKVNCPGLECEFPVLFTGNLGSAQAVHVILEAAELMKNYNSINFVIVGNGSKREWMIKQGEKKSLTNLFFPGNYPVEVMPELMSRAGALLITLADTEIFSLTVPSKVQAYLAAGKPIVGCLNGAGADIIRDANAGVTVPAEDSAALARAIYWIKNQPYKDQAMMGMNGRLYYERNFSHEKLIHELIEHFILSINQYLGRKS